MKLRVCYDLVDCYLAQRITLLMVYQLINFRLTQQACWLLRQNPISQVNTYTYMSLMDKEDTEEQIITHRPTESLACVTDKSSIESVVQVKY